MMKIRKVICKKQDERIKYPFIANIERNHRFIDKLLKKQDLKLGYKIKGWE